MKLPFFGNVANPGGVVVGPSYKSSTIIYMSDTPLVSAVTDSIPKLERAVQKIEQLESDEALQELKEVLGLLSHGLPPDSKKEIWKTSTIDSIPSQQNNKKPEKE